MLIQLAPKEDCITSNNSNSINSLDIYLILRPSKTLRYCPASFQLLLSIASLFLLFFVTHYLYIFLACSLSLFPFLSSNILQTLSIRSSSCFFFFHLLQRRLKYLFNLLSMYLFCFFFHHVFLFLISFFTYPP